MLEVFKIKSGNTSAIIVPERGGLVSRFKVLGKDILYCDQETVDDPSKSIRAGVPLLFPQTGPLPENSKFPLKQHGFARNMSWEVISKSLNSISLELKDTTESRKVFPFSFRLVLEVGVMEGELIHIMTITNTGDKVMPTAYGLHPYFYLPNSEKVEIETNINNFDPKGINWDEIFDKRFSNPGHINVKTSKRSFKIKTDPELFPHLAIWSLPQSDFICIEPWSRLEGALEETFSSVLINPGESLDYRFSILVSSKD